MSGTQVTLGELVKMASDLAMERTDGSAPALYLLVERMRPVLLALVGTIAEMRQTATDVAAELNSVAEDLDQIQVATEALQRERDELRAEVERLRKPAFTYG